MIIGNVKGVSSFGSWSVTKFREVIKDVASSQRPNRRNRTRDSPWRYQHLDVTKTVRSTNGSLVNARESED